MSAEEIISILTLFDTFDGPDTDMLWWRADGGYAPITFIVNCNDLFAWGCSDCETIAPIDVPDFQKALADSRECDDMTNAHLLWVARKRGQRPQVAYYKHFTDNMKVLFDACGSASTQYGR